MVLINIDRILHHSTASIRFGLSIMLSIVAISRIWVWENIDVIPFRTDQMCSTVRWLYSSADVNGVHIVIYICQTTHCFIIYHQKTYPKHTHTTITTDRQSCSMCGREWAEGEARGLRNYPILWHPLKKYIRNNASDTSNRIYSDIHSTLVYQTMIMANDKQNWAWP